MERNQFEGFELVSKRLKLVSAARASLAELPNANGKTAVLYEAPSDVNTLLLGSTYPISCFAKQKVFLMSPIIQDQ